MNYSTYRISLDIHATNSQAMLNIKKDDTARKIYFSLTDGVKPYQIAEGCNAVFRAKKPDGTILYNNCIINGNVIEYTLTSQTSASVGIVECEVTLYGSDSLQITSPHFSLVVEDYLYSDSQVESQNEFTALTKAITETQATIEGISKVNATVSKEGKTATITTVDNKGVTHTATVSDGADGKDGTNGTNGTDGTDGQDGISVTGASINASGHLIITLSNSTTIDAGVAKGADGKDGTNGTNGTDGDDGISVTGVVINSSGHLIVTLSSGSTIDAGYAKGDKGATGATGADGYTPVRGVDYWTNADKDEIKAYVDEAILGGAW